MSNQLAVSLKKCLKHFKTDIIWHFQPWRAALAAESSQRTYCYFEGQLRKPSRTTNKPYNWHHCTAPVTFTLTAIILQIIFRTSQIFRCWQALTFTFIRSLTNATERHVSSPTRLPIDDRIQLKLAVLTHSLLSSGQPEYVRSVLSHQCPSRSLRSSNTGQLSVPLVHTAFTSHGLSVAATIVWNCLPADGRTCPSSLAFHHLLKTHFFPVDFQLSQRPIPVPPIRPMADTVHLKDLFTYLLALCGCKLTEIY